MSEIKTTNNQIILQGMDGKEQVYNILFLVESKEFKKNYVVYYLEDSAQDENIELIASSYEGNLDGENSENLQLFEVETDEEWAMLNNALTEFTDFVEDI